MIKEIKVAKVCILTCPFKPLNKSKHGFEIKSAEDYEKRFEIENKILFGYCIESEKFMKKRIDFLVGILL
jgi:hypothetical protein